MLQVSSIRGRADLEYSRRVVEAASRSMIITDPVITLAKNFTSENFLKGGHESCGILPKSVRYSQATNEDLDLEDKEFLYNENKFIRRNMTVYDPIAEA